MYFFYEPIRFSTRGCDFRYSLVSLRVMEVITQGMLRRLRRGDERAWQDFYGQMLPVVTEAVAGYLKQKNLPANLKEDLVQDIFIKAWRNIKANKCPQNGDFTRDGLKVWITNILRNWSPQRSPNKVFNAKLPSTDATESSEDLRAHVRDGCRCTDAAMLMVEIEAALTPKEYQLFRAVYDGHSLQDIARQEGISYQAVQKRWKKLCPKLRRLSAVRELLDHA